MTSHLPFIRARLANDLNFHPTDAATPETTTTDEITRAQNGLESTEKIKEMTTSDRMMEERLRSAAVAKKRRLRNCITICDAIFFLSIFMSIFAGADGCLVLLLAIPLVALVAAQACHWKLDIMERE